MASGAGWETVAEHDGAPAVLAGLVGLEPDQAYTRSEVAEAAGVPLKTLYLGDTLAAFVEAGVLEPVDAEEGEATYAVDGESQVLAAARQFDEALGEALAD